MRQIIYFQMWLHVTILGKKTNLEWRFVTKNYVEEKFGTVIQKKRIVKSKLSFTK